MHLSLNWKTINGQVVVTSPQFTIVCKFNDPKLSNIKKINLIADAKRRKNQTKVKKRYK